MSAAPVAARALGVWLVIPALAILNGFLREKLLVPALGDGAGMVASGLLLCAIVFAVAYALLPWVGARGTKSHLLIGALWLLLTLLFEFSLGLWRGESLSALLDAYTFRGGNLWPVVVVFTALSPWLVARLRNWT